MAFTIPRNQTISESLQQAFGLAAPGLIQGAQQRQMGQLTQNDMAALGMALQGGGGSPQAGSSPSQNFISQTGAVPAGGTGPANQGNIMNRVLSSAGQMQSKFGRDLIQKMIFEGIDPFGIKSAEAGQILAETGFLQGPKTELTRAQAEETLAKAGFIRGPQTEKALAEAGFIRGPKTALTFAQRDLALADAQASGQVTLGPGSNLFDRSTGRPIAGSPFKPEPAAPPRAGALQVSGESDPSGLPQGTVFQADPQGNVKIISQAGGEGLSASDRAKLAISQGKEFRDTATVKNFRTVETMERGIQSALRVALNPKTKSKAFADQALVIGFNKLLDPSSVVRESEFARTPQGIALFNRLEAGVEKIVKGGVGITNADRQALASMSAKLLNESKRSFNATFGDFETRANELGLNTRVIFGKQKLQSVTNDSAPSRATLNPADLDNMTLEQLQNL